MIKTPLTHGSLFSGIGGPDLAAEWLGWDNKFHCEWNEFGKQILKYYWPNAVSYDDITKSNFNVWRGRIDVLSGGFPCQPYSAAGKRKGKEDERHLWPEMLRAIREIAPRWIVGENVLGLVNWNGGLVFDEIQAELEAEGYEVQPFILPAGSVDAPHRRDRVFFVAYLANSDSRSKRSPGKGNRINKERRGNFSQPEERGKPPELNIGRRHVLSDERHMADADRPGLQKLDLSELAKEPRHHTGKNNKNEFRRNNWENFPAEPPICHGNNGIPEGLDGITVSKWRNESIKAGGNAIVPQLIYQIFAAIQEYEDLYN